MGAETDTPGDLVIHPLRRASPARSWVAATVWIACCVGFVLRFHGVTRVLVGAMDAAICVFILVWMRRLARGTRLGLHGEAVVYDTALGRTVIDAGTTLGVIELTVDLGAFGAGTRRCWCLVDGSGQTVLSLNLGAWPAAELSELARRLDLPRDVWRDLHSPREAQQAIPGVLPWWYATPWRALLLGLAVLVGLGGLIDAALH